MRRLLLSLGLALTAVVASAAPAFADALTVRTVDATKFPKVAVSMLIAGTAPGIADFHLRENGKLVTSFEVTPIGKSATAMGTVLLVDTSGSMADNGKLDAAKAAARNFVARKLTTDWMAVVAFNEVPHVVVNLTTDVTLLSRGIDGLKAAGGTALWDGVRAAAELFDAKPDLQANLVVLSDGRDTVSQTSEDAARATLLGHHAAAFVIAYEGSDQDVASLRQLAEPTGGQALTTADPRAVDGLYASVQRTLQGQYQLTYTSSSTGSSLDLELSAGQLRATASVNRGALAQGSSANPEKVASSRSLLDGTLGRLVIAVLALAAVGIAVYVALGLVIQGGSRLEDALALYDADSVDDDSADGDRPLATTAIMRRAVDATARLAENRNVLPGIERLLEQADVPLRAPEALLFGSMGLALCAVLAGMVTRSLLLGLLVFLIGCAVPPIGLRLKAAGQRRKFMSQLPDTLQLLAGSLRAGYSLLQGVEAVSQEVDDPMGRELRRILAEARLGRALEDALDDSASRMGSADFDWAVMAVRIQREVGGNLAELLTTVNETMVARERLRREVRALTAEGRISAFVLGLLPIGIGLALWVINPDYMNVLFDRSIGKALLAGSGLVAVFGFVWMKKIITIEA